MKKTALHFSYHLALLLALPIAFILTYVWLYFNPSITIYQHLNAILLFVLSIFSIKLLINHYCSSKKLILFVGTILYSSFIFGLILYYSLVLIGLHSWNRVITEELIVAYTAQASFLLDALDISYHLVIVSLTLTYALVAIGCFFFLKKFHWLPNRHPSTTWLIGPLLFCLCLFFGFYFCIYVTSTDKASKEPIKLTLLSGKHSGQQIHNAKLDYSSSQRLNSAENAARSHYQKSPSSQKRNLIVFVVDALRHDHTSIYGYQRDTTPHLKNIAMQHKASIFTNVRSVCGETTCGHAGYMASRFIHQLPDHLFTLQDVLKLNGYRTNLIISGDHINFQNIREVYGHVDDYYDGSMATGFYFNDDKITVNKTRSLPEWDGKPTMIHYHILSAHQVGKKDRAYSRYTPAKSYYGKSSGAPEIKYTNFYDNGILQADSVVKELLDILGTKKYLENSLVIVTSDHGEALGEHNVFMHTNSVIEEALHVPLVMIPYGYESELPKKYDRFMSLVDLAPSILKEFNINIPESWTGTPIQQEMKRPFTFFEMTPYRGLYDHRDNSVLWKYWKNKHTNEEFAFNLTSDPEENDNLIWSVPANLKKEWRKMTDFEATH